MEDLGPGPNILAPCGSGRRSVGIASSPEFEFCSSFSHSDIVSAADLFSGGVILPLPLNRQLRPSDDILPTAPPTDPEPSWLDRPPPEPETFAPESARLSASHAAAAASSSSSSMRWMNIFRKNDKKPSRRSIDADAEKDIISAFREMSKKRERRNSIGGATAELNINIWPFARSRSAGNGASRPPPPRKASSAPCSRSNSGGDSKSRRWPGSPGRGGIPIGRSSPVWQARRIGGGRRTSEVVVRKDGNEGRRKIPLPGGGGKAKVSSSNVMGKRQQSSCRSEESSRGGGARGGGRVSGEGLRGSSLFNIKSLFTKKVY